MSLFATFAPLLMLQVGPNPNAANQLGTPDELLNRPSRPEQSIEPSSPEARWLADCLEQIETDAARAHTKAQIRLAEVMSGGPQWVIANHCLGLASTELGLWNDARAAFVAARDFTPADEVRAKARFGAMAGNAALAGGDAASALGHLEIARADAAKAASAPLQVIAALDTSRALVLLDRPEEALGPLEAAIRLAPQNSEAWLLKATLLRRLDRLPEAQATIEEAVGLAPLDGAIGVEAGVIAIMSGREDAARQSWQSVIDTQPDSVAANTAKAYLAQIGGTAEPPQNAPQPEQTNP